MSYDVFESHWPTFVAYFHAGLESEWYNTRQKHLVVGKITTTHNILPLATLSGPLFNQLPFCLLSV